MKMKMKKVQTVIDEEPNSSLLQKIVKLDTGIFVKVIRVEAIYTVETLGNRKHLRLSYNEIKDGDIVPPVD